MNHHLKNVKEANFKDDYQNMVQNSRFFDWKPGDNEEASHQNSSQ